MPSELIIKPLCIDGVFGDHAEAASFLASPARVRNNMKILAERIRQELKAQLGKRRHCAVYENELQRIWPLDEKNRESKIARFAKDHGFQLRFYKQGLCAIFEKRKPNAKVAGEHSS